MQDGPDALQILGTVITHLRERLLPTLEGRAIFEMRVVLSALELVRREFTLKPTSDSAETGRLRAYLHDDDLDLHRLNQLLCDMVNTGLADVDTPGLLDLLHQTAIEKLAIDQPNYAAYQRAIAETP